MTKNSEEEFGIFNERRMMPDVRCCIMIRPNSGSCKFLFLSNITVVHVPSSVNYSVNFSFKSEKNIMFQAAGFWSTSFSPESWSKYSPDTVLDSLKQRYFKGPTIYLLIINCYVNEKTNTNTEQASDHNNGPHLW